MSTSSIPTLKSALITRLNATTGISGSVGVSYGYPFPLTDVFAKGENIYVGNTRPDDPTSGDSPYAGGGQRSASLGALHREERYVLEVDVWVAQDGRESQQTITERGFTIVGLVETSIRTWTATTPAAYDGAVRWCLVTRVVHEEWISPNGDTRGVTVHIDLACSARI